MPNGLRVRSSRLSRLYLLRGSENQKRLSATQFPTRRTIRYTEGPGVRVLTLENQPPVLGDPFRSSN